MKTETFHVVLDREADGWRVYQGAAVPENELAIESGIDTALAHLTDQILDSRCSFPHGYTITLHAREGLAR